MNKEATGASLITNYNLHRCVDCGVPCDFTKWVREMSERTLTLAEVVEEAQHSPAVSAVEGPVFYRKTPKNPAHGTVTGVCAHKKGAWAGTFEAIAIVK